MEKLRVLVSAYACNPIASQQLHPGEDITGWRYVQQLSRFHNVWVITHSYNREGVENGQASGELSGVKFYFVNLPSWLWLLYKLELGQRIYYYLWQILAWKVARGLHCEFHFEVAQHITFNNDWMPSFIGALLSVPFVWGPVGGGQATPRGRGFMTEYSLYGHIFDLSRIVAQWLGRHSIFRRLCVRRARAILVCNRETKMKIPRKYIDKVHLFPVNGILPEDLASEPKEKTPGGSFCVITSGRLVYWKGFDLAIRAFGIFAQEFPLSELVIIGDGNEGPRLRRLAENLGLQSKVNFIPWLPREELLAKMRSGDVFLYPSLREGGGAVVVEAMASGKPVVCLDAAGPGFHIQDQWGIKVMPKSPEYVVQEMAKALERLYRDRDLRDRLGEAARRRAEEFYLWDRLGEKMQEIYEKALKGVGSTD